MANFPDVLPTVYVPGGTPVVKAADLNAGFAETVRLWRALRGADFLVEDEFTGDSLNRGIWGNSQYPLTFQGDASNPGACGTAIIGPSGIYSNAIVTQPMTLGTLDFRCLAALRFPNYATVTTTGEFDFVLTDLFTTTLGFRMTRTATALANVTVAAAGSGLTSTNVDSGVPVPTGTYSRFEIRRSGSVIAFVINDVVVYVLPYTGSFGGLGAFLSAPNALQGQIDYFKMHVIRQPVSSATLGQALGAHAESKTVTFNGTQDFVDIVWTNPFADNNYRLPAPGIFVSSGPLVITASYTSKTPTGIRVVPSARFTGEVYVDAHE